MKISWILTIGLVLSCASVGFSFLPGMIVDFPKW